MPADAQERLISNIVGSMASVPREIQMRQLCHFFRADPNYGMGIARGLGIDLSAMMNQQAQREVAHA